MSASRLDRLLGAPAARVRVGRATLAFYTGDAVALLSRLAPASVSAVVTSPPYNLGVRYRSYRDTLPREQYLAWTGAWVAAVARVLAPQGSLFLNVGGKPKDPWIPFDVAGVARAHLRLQNTIHWVKSIAIDREAAGDAAGLDRDLAVGHYKPINSERFLNDCHEFVFHFTPGGDTPLDRLAIGVPYQDASNIGRWRRAAGGLRCRGNTWFIPYDTIQSRARERPHPATYPPRLAEFCLRLHGCDRLQLVVDPFLGLGSTAIAAAALGVDFVGIDVDPAYVEIAAARVEASAAALEKVRDAGRTTRGRARATAPRRSTGAARTLPFD
jgi:site-specific DNA-methyltransferase (adenine-specific)